MKQVKACLSAWEDRGWCKPVYVWERSDNAVLTSEVVL